MTITKEQLVELVSLNGELVPKRCTESYLQNHNLIDNLDALVDASFGTVSERIKFLKYGGGYCKVCNVRTKVHVSGKGFGEYCKDHFHEPKKGKVAHNRKELDIDLIKKLYFDERKTILEISKILGDVSNVTIKNQLKNLGIELRSHSENQMDRSPFKGRTNPFIIIDREKLVHDYVYNKIPTEILSKQHNCHPETIRRFLKQESVQQTHRTTSIEWLIFDILDRNNIKYQSNCRTLISPLEVDFYLPNHNIAIETNGIYHHSFYAGNKNSRYHKKKYDDCLLKNVKLFQFWEYDILEKSNIIESMILNSCKLNKFKIDARKCTIRNIDNQTLSSFCEQNHIQGSPGKGTKGLGLYHNDLLVSVIGLTTSKGYTIITRFCSLLHHNVRGAFGKFLSTLDGNIKTYSSNDISDGKLYQNNGFECVAENVDMYYTDYKLIYNRQGFMKHKLKDKLNKFDENLTEIQNMFENGYDVIYKSGTKTWIKFN